MDGVSAHVESVSRRLEPRPDDVEDEFPLMLLLIGHGLLDERLRTGCAASIATVLCLLSERLMGGRWDGEDDGIPDSRLHLVTEAMGVVARVGCVEDVSECRVMAI